REGVHKCGPVITDCGNQILDCLWQIPVAPEKMEDAINGIPGVVETGFFTKHRPVVFYSTQDGNVEIRR
ncbi:MAG: ribose-5-phosphate isomerase A, partial [Treponemataceae bacterium]|nr:ribose-5-phosphate isomerase A [Treponemataceae bacterium]